MKLKTILLMLAVAAFASCDIESKNCPRMVEVPFVWVSIPDSIGTGMAFTVDVKLHDFGCYQTAEVLADVQYDTVYLTAYAYYDECGCPKSSNLSLSYRMALDTARHNTNKYFSYMVIDESRDSVRLRVDTLKVY